MKPTPILVWFRLDLRLQDNPALRAAVAHGGPVIPIYVHDEAAEGRWPPGAAARWWLHHSLTALDQSLRGRGSRLILARGDSLNLLRILAKGTGAGAVYWINRPEPAAAVHDRKIANALQADGLEVQRFDRALLYAPTAVRTSGGGPFQIFTPFWRRCQETPVDRPRSLPPGRLAGPKRWPRSEALAHLGLLPAIRWDAGLGETWQPGEGGAQRRLRRFVANDLSTYAARRDRPDLAGTSGLSPHLHFGELSPHQVWMAVVTRVDRHPAAESGARIFLKEVGWREFAGHLMHHFPDTARAPLRAAFRTFPWRQDPTALRAWQRGRTGFPIVDAGMRQLWHAGWMHNRVRMIVASFLVKDLGLSWREGAAWFWDTLVDADLANNTLGWQWTAGCGADAAPFFRIFNPVLQGRRYDPAGDYVRRWIPELAALPARHIHAPWEAPPAVLVRAKVRLGTDYPRPIVDHAAARAAALRAYELTTGRGLVSGGEGRIQDAEIGPRRPKSRAGGGT